MIERTLVIKNKMGLHARPSAQFVETACKYESDVTLIKDDMEVNGKSIMGLLMLAAERGSEIILKTDGCDEQEMFDALNNLLEGKFNEE